MRHRHRQMQTFYRVVSDGVTFTALALLAVTLAALLWDATTRFRFPSPAILIVLAIVLSAPLTAWAGWDEWRSHEPDDRSAR